MITYIGNKRKILPYIELLINELCCGKKMKILDGCAGSCTVSFMLAKYASFLHVNDTEGYSKRIADALFTKHNVDFDYYNNIPGEVGFITELYSPPARMFYTTENAMKIDAIRQSTNDNHIIASLLIKASKHVNTCGVFKGFYKNWGGRGSDCLDRILKPIIVEPLPYYPIEYTATQKSIFDIKDHYDIIYLDPPYNQHQYGSNYFMLNLINEYKKPENISKVSGIPPHFKSSFCSKKTAQESINKCINELNYKYLILSYSNAGFANISGYSKKIEIDYQKFRGARNYTPGKVTEYIYLFEK